MMSARRLFTIGLLLVAGWFARAQTVIQLEYWANDMFANRATVAFSGNLLLPTAGLPTGVHQLHFRLIDSQGRYSAISSQWFVKTGGSSVNSLEYWVNDLYVNRASIPINGEGVYDLQLLTAGLTAGVYQLHFRLGDAQGYHSAISSHWFVKTGGNSVNTLEYWVNDLYANRAPVPINGEGVYDLQLLTAGLNAGVYQLHFRLGDAQGYYSAVSSHWFLKTNYSTESGVRVLEYWFDDDIDNLQTQTLTSPNELVSLDVATADLSQGVHRITFRTGMENGIYSPPTTEYFMAGKNPFEPTPSESLVISEYSYRFNDDEAVTVPINNPSGIYSLNTQLDASGLDPDKSHEISIQFTRNDGARSIIVKESFEIGDGTAIEPYDLAAIAFINGIITFNGLNAIPDSPETWDFAEWNSEMPRRLVKLNLDDRNLTGTLFLAGLSSLQELNVSDNSLTDLHIAGCIGLQYLLGSHNHLSTVDLSGLDQLVFVSLPNQSVSLAMTRNNADIYEGAIDLTNPVFDVVGVSYDEVTGILTSAERLASVGFSSETGSPFGDVSGRLFFEYDMAAAYIRNLEPNINPSSYIVKDLATIYRYFKVVDEDGNPIQGAKIEYEIDSEEHSSLPSDEEGIVTIEFSVLGKNWLAPRQMKFVRLKDSTGNPLDGANNYNTFGIPTVEVHPYQADEFKLTFEAGGKASTEIASQYEYVDAKISGSINAGLEFTSVLDHAGIIKEMKYAFLAGAKGSGGLKVGIINDKALDWLSIEPKMSIGAGLESGLSTKLKGEIAFENNLKSYLVVGYDILCLIYAESGSTNKAVNAMMNMVGNYLQDATPPSSKVEGTFGGYVKGNGKIDFKIDNTYEWMKVFDKGLDLSATVDGKFGFDLTVGNKYANGQEGMYNSLKYIVGWSVDVEGDLWKKYGKFAEKFGLSYNAAALSSVKYNREYRNGLFTSGLNEIKKASIEINHGHSTQVTLDWKLVSMEVNTDKSHKYKYSIEQPVFDYLRKHPNLITPIDPMWSYFNNDYVSLVLGRDKETYLDGIISKMNDIDFTDSPQMNNSFSLVSTKKYAASVEIEKTISIDSKWLGLDWKTSISGKGEMEGEYPLEEAYYHPATQQFMPIVTYEDTDKPAYYFSPFVGTNSFVAGIDNIWDEVTNALNSWSDQILDKAKSFWGDVVAFFNPWDDDETKKGNKVLTNIDEHNRDMPRLYSKNLTQYNELRSSAQTNVSAFEFVLPGDNQAFEDNTEVHLKYYYPGGELLGATIDKDTFIVISDVFFLSAVHNNIILETAPLGDFKVFATAGTDDLSFLGINQSYPVSVYFSALEDNWERIGETNDSIATNKMGTYCLGVSVNSDKLPPVIHISKEENAGKVKIAITDNMAVYWKSVFVLINGVVTEYSRNGNLLSVDLDNGQLQNDIYVTAYASDLARNETKSDAVFPKSESEPKTDATLSSLSVSNGILTPAFSSNVRTYSVNVANTVTEITLTATPNNAKATVIGAGVKQLTAGANTFTITVTAEDGVTKSVYTVTVNRASASLGIDASLSGLTVSAGELNPAFSSTVYTYMVNVANSVTEITVTATPNDAKATVSGNNGTSQLTTGVNTLFITVTAEDGATFLEYIILVTRADDETVSAIPQDAVSGLKVYPNPTTGKLRIERGALEIKFIRLIDFVGRIVLSQNGDGETAKEINISHLPAGIYFLQVDGETVKIVKQ